MERNKANLITVREILLETTFSNYSFITLETIEAIEKTKELALREQS